MTPLPHPVSHRAATLLATLCILVSLSACGTKYSNPTQAPQPRPTLSDTELLPPLPPASETAPTAPTVVSPEIKPTSVPADDTPRLLCVNRQPALPQVPTTRVRSGCWSGQFAFHRTIRPRLLRLPKTILLTTDHSRHSNSHAEQ